MTTAHIPVLAEELLELLDPRPGQTVVDCTFGGGGHARALAERLGSQGTLVAIDRDPLAQERFLELAQEIPCSARFIRGDYAEGLEMLGEEGVLADAVYFDLGMSSMQIDTRERGFSYSYDAPLDMRMDPRQELTAREIVATWDERRLAGILREFGEERHAAQIARAIVRARAQAPIETTLALVEVDQRRDSHPGSLCRRASRQAHLPGVCESPSTTSWDSSIGRCRLPGACCARAACLPRSPSTRWRTGA